MFLLKLGVGVAESRSHCMLSDLVQQVQIIEQKWIDQECQTCFH